MNSVTGWKFQTSTIEAWDYLLNSCASAKQSIDIEQYILGDSGIIIEKLSAILKQRAREGVRVRLLLDAFGSFSFYRSALRKELEEAGVRIVFHSTVLPPSWGRVFPFWLRDHRKLMIFDEQSVHVSGFIIHERAELWRDTGVVLTGSIVADATHLFNTAWERAMRSHPIGRVLTDEGKGEFYLAGNSFRLRDKHLYRAIVRNIASAKKTIYITTPYFSLTNDLRRALWYARRKGVEICFLMPKRSDNMLADIVSRFYYHRLLRRGIKIFHYTKSILHAKSITVDGTWATIGSCNLDWLSIRLNYELNVVSENPEFASELEAIFLKDIETSVEVTSRTAGWYGFW